MPSVDRQRGAAGHQVGPPDQGGIQALQGPVIEGQHGVLDRFLQEEVLQLLELLRVLRGQVVRQAEVRPGVVQLPRVVFERRPGLEFPRRPVDGAGQPAVVVDGAVAEDLEVLGRVPARRLGVREGVGQAHAFDGRLRRPVHALRLGQAGRLQDRRRDVDDVVPLRAHLALRRDALGPVDHHPVAGAAVARGDLLRPGEGRVARDGPPGGVVRVGRRAAKLVVVLQDVLDGLVHAVEVGHLVEEPVHAAFGARAVVADDVEDQRVVELTRSPRWPGSAGRSP